MQSIVAYVNLTAYYLVGIPVGAVLGFVFDMEVKVSYFISFIFHDLILTKIVDTLSVPAISAGMYCIGVYTGIETLTFYIGLNIGRTGYTGQFYAIPAGMRNIGQYAQY